MSQLSMIHNDDGAILSTNHKYRYDLWRKWDSSLPFVLFICLNPSTADATIDDPTIRRCRGFAKSWGYGGFHMLNLYAFRATDPKDLAKARDPIGPSWKSNMNLAIYQCADVVCAWGAHPMAVERGKEMIAMLKKDLIQAKCIKQTNAGHPGHPLYLKKDLKPKYYM